MIETQREVTLLFEKLPGSSHALFVLRPITEADLAVWYRYLSTPAVYEHTSWNVSAVSDLAPFVWRPEACTDSPQLRMAIALRETGELIGTAGFHSVSPQHRVAELAYDLSPDHWGRGIATSACSLLVDWAHREASVLRVQATVLESNARSASVLKRVGFEWEGLLRSYRLVRGTPGNFHMYSHVSALLR